MVRRFEHMQTFEGYPVPTTQAFKSTKVEHYPWALAMAGDVALADIGRSQLLRLGFRHGT